MYEIKLSPRDIATIQELEEVLVTQFDSVADPDFLRQACTYAQELPRPLRARLNEFRLMEPSSLCLIDSHPIDEERIGATPDHWYRPDASSTTLREEFFFFLCACLLGDPIGWATQQGQRIMHDVLPIRGHERMQINSASEATILWHTEDAFHPYRTEYVGLMCLRNPDNVATTYASLDDIELDPLTVRVLFEPRFVIRPDESHLVTNDVGVGPDDERRRQAYEKIRRLLEDPERIAVLFGDPRQPYMRLDPYFMDRSVEDDDARRALDELIVKLTERLKAVALQPGQVVFIDNYKAVHGRQSFRARYDGRDRWLKRLNVTRDLRKSREARVDAGSRILY